MKKLLFIFIILLFSILSYANSFIELGGEIKVPFPDGWIVSDSLADYPYQIINKEQSGELLIFKSIISKPKKDPLLVMFEHAFEIVIGHEGGTGKWRECWKTRSLW